MAKAQKKAAPLNIQVTARQRALIEQAASAAEMTVSDFVRDAALLQAKNALLDRTNIAFEGKAMCEAEELLRRLEAQRPKVLSEKAIARLNELAKDKDKALDFLVRAGTHDKDGNLMPQYK